jgi:hypothetical protein
MMNPLLISGRLAILGAAIAFGSTSAFAQCEARGRVVWTLVDQKSLNDGKERLCIYERTDPQMGGIFRQEKVVRDRFCPASPC